MEPLLLIIANQRKELKVCLPSWTKFGLNLDYWVHSWPRYPPLIELLFNYEGWSCHFKDFQRFRKPSNLSWHQTFIISADEILQWGNIIKFINLLMVRNIDERTSVSVYNFGFHSHCINFDKANQLSLTAFESFLEMTTWIFLPSSISKNVTNNE